MTDSNDNCNFPIPNWFRRRLEGLLFPEECLEDILNQIGCLEFEESNKIKASNRVWGSKTMTLEKKKSKTLDMFLTKGPKIETSNLDLDDSVIGFNNSSVSRHSHLTDYPRKNHCDELCTKSPHKENKKVHSKVCKTTSTDNSEMDEESRKLRIKNSPTYSGDLFAEEVFITTSTSNSPKISKIKRIEHSISDEEIIPSSQTQKNVSRFSLGSLSAYSNSKKSMKISSANEDSCISQKENNMEQRMSISSNEQTLSTRGDYSSGNEHQPISHLDSIENSMKNINEVLTESGVEKFGFGDLTDDDEVYILQCPSEVDTMQLEGVTLSLQGSSTVSFANEENNKYDCYSVKGNSQRCLYIVLPDADKEEMKIGIYPLAGNVILSENFEIPCTASFKDNCDLRKRSSICNNESTGEEPRNNSETSDERPRKKKRKLGSEDEAVSTECLELLTDESPDKFVSKKKKKKKHKNTEGGLEDEAVLTEFVESLTDKSPDKLVSKKKKHKNTEEETWNAAALNRCFSQKATEVVIEQFVSKKKKKKHSNTESNGLDSNMSDFNQVLSIKTELEEPQTTSESQETPSKSKRRKGKDMEEYGESIEEIPKRKKKKRHSESAFSGENKLCSVVDNIEKKNHSSLFSSFYCF